jgi:hypothetical protein
MIKFFRKIRHRLLNEGKTTRYFKYAFGEIILVVMGILIALQVNNWNIKQNNRKYEQGILIELKKEFENNLAQLEEKRFIRQNLIMSSTQWLFNVMNGEYLNIELDTINHHLSRTLIVPSYDPMISITTELINSGNLRLIENTELRTRLTVWPNSANDFVRDESEFVTFMYEYYFMFLIKNYRLQPLVNELQNDDALYNIIKTKRRDFNLMAKENNNELNQLFQNKDFEDYLSIIMGFCNFLNNGTSTLVASNTEILELIESEIHN